MDENRLAEIEAGHMPDLAVTELVAEVRRLRGCLAIAHDGYDTAYAELERLRARVAELEEGMYRIASSADTERDAAMAAKWLDGALL